MIIRYVQFFISILILAQFFTPSTLEACKTYRDIPIFYSRDEGQCQGDDNDEGGDIRHPYVPLKEYATGNIGVVRPQYGYVYLWIAYRYLTEKPLAKADVEFF